MERIPIILDTDIGDDIDDLYALYFALCHPAIDVRAVTTVFGDSLRRARLVHKVLRMAGREDIPVGVGMRLSHQRKKRQQLWPDAQSVDSYLDFVAADDPEIDMQFPTAQEVFYSVFRNCEQQTAIVGIGALSNIAAFIDNVTAPEICQQIKCIAIMGGENDLLINDWNMLCDPEAADIVLSSEFTVFMGTSQLTSRIIMPMEQVEAEFGHKPEPMYRALSECTRLWAKKNYPHRPGPVLYDLAPLCWLANPKSITTKTANIRVELNGDFTRGQTVRIAETGNTLESTTLDAAALVQEFIETIHRVHENG